MSCVMAVGKKTRYSVGFEMEGRRGTMDTTQPSMSPQKGYAKTGRAPPNDKHAMWSLISPARTAISVPVCSPRRCGRALGGGSVCCII